ncbi:uncharacterized protein LOC121420801 [Lytechinus variegatus]|uniref:uncharacterized protein LOC121420801 n=1 Tax=Lytechinus variegatus TaxID=7654 RepID=UPI001BB24C20|nr:uncharacterized protein LOC121420801 [Lytechinus variegatus]XP_041471372.1 uncharacterized protein LOC121420801 [Lytechinus variegatus]
MGSLGLLVLTVIALSQTGSAEYCFSCFSTRSNIQFDMFEGQWGSNGTVRNETGTHPTANTSWPDNGHHGDCYYPNEFQQMYCEEGSGCEKLNAEVLFTYMEGGNTQWGSFHVIYMGCGSSSHSTGCDASPGSVLEYLLPYKDGIDYQIGKSLDWEEVVSGKACSCSGDFCNAATNVKMSCTLMLILSLFTFFWNKF